MVIFKHINAYYFGTVIMHFKFTVDVPFVLHLSEFRLSVESLGPVKDLQLQVSPLFLVKNIQEIGIDGETSAIDGNLGDKVDFDWLFGRCLLLINFLLSVINYEFSFDNFYHKL